MEIITVDTQILLDAIFRGRSCHYQILDFINSNNVFITYEVYEEALGITTDFFRIAQASLKTVLENTSNWNNFTEEERIRRLRNIDALKNTVKILQAKMNISGKRVNDIVNIIVLSSTELSSYSREELMELIDEGKAFKPIVDTFNMFVEYYKNKILFRPLSSSAILNKLEQIIKKVFDVKKFKGDPKILYEMMCILNEGYGVKITEDITEVRNIERITFYTRDEGFINRYNNSFRNYISNNVSEKEIKNTIVNLYDRLTFKLFKCNKHTVQF